ncbi:MAG: response regulator [Desulfuromonadaceae bacterium]|nr:response regulator [Desulfuromonas sp.]MDY0184598.1 response regulator [Desulfuromonadaceae bacterium]
MVGGKNTVLIVDDSPTVRRLVELVLSQNGFDVISAEDGESGLEMARQHHPRIILVDFVMPRMNGHMFCKELREDEHLRDVPVILVSSKSDVVGQAFEESFGIVHYFTKPFEPDVLVAKINEVLQKVDETERETGALASKADGNFSVSETTATGDTQSEKVNSGISIDLINDKIDKVVRAYFQKDFPVLMKNVLADTLKEAGLVKHQTLVLSGDLSEMSLAEILNFCANTLQNGRLTVFSDDTFAEIFLDCGCLVFATASQKGTHTFLIDMMRDDNRFTCDNKVLQEVILESRVSGVPIGRALVARNIISEEDLMYYLRQHAQDAVTKAMVVGKGSFFLEKDEIPHNLTDISFRMPMPEVLLVGARPLPPAPMFFEEGLRVQRLPACADLMQRELLTYDEADLVAKMDGRTMAELLAVSEFSADVVRGIASTLYMAGAVAIS